jgi:glycosyltransferase involved in cell wall biosynthesis
MTVITGAGRREQASAAAGIPASERKMSRNPYPLRIEVVIPCYRVRRKVSAVIRAALAEAAVHRVVVVDDACPDGTGDLVAEGFGEHPRVALVRHETNRGVGGAMLTGYRHAFDNGADIVVKVDGDGQMDPTLIPLLVAPIARGEADYAKGNRFFYPRNLKRMPRGRLFGNSLLSLVSKFSSGYWSIMDPTNGFTALHRLGFQQLDTEKLDRRYFFESDMLFQLGIGNAVVVDVPMPVVYADESSNLSVPRAALQFPFKHLNRFVKRIAYKYFIRDFTIASLEILCGLPALAAGLIFGAYQWAHHAQLGQTTPAGTVMIVGLLIIVGFQLLLSAVNFDITHEPSLPLQHRQPEPLTATPPALVDGRSPSRPGPRATGGERAASSKDAA